ncbi:uncharacterized protein LOC124354525 [Homalodisca vitripennis]|uniref:uncharacterized protein LOC124354525 n=1 Tax=Homalodisca vitripennis TaxID=197043 RepID=UPI001EEB13FB|nr:uncharacterized protein LOC124354525 [Homalodisca vitripennis]
MVNDVNNVTFMEEETAESFPKWEDEVVESYWMMGSPLPVTILMCGYLVFVTRLGPYLMSKRPPFDLKYIMMFYNVFQVVYNIWFLSLFLRESHFMKYMMEESCHPRSPSRNIVLRQFAFKVTWVWLMSKVADLIDTVFFVLRKKQTHISFLHLYHHTHMVLIVWLYMKYVRGEQGIMIGLVNSAVHIIMYSYYFLSALGPRVQQYLWWKKYITWLQLFQFFVLMVFFMALLISCSVPPLQTAYNAYAFLQGVIFTVLFMNFYFNSYSKPTKKSSNVCQGKEMNGNLPKLSKIMEEWFLVQTPYPMITILAIYLLIVLKLGPKYMEGRPPYRLGFVMRLYNIVQVFYNSIIVFHLLTPQTQDKVYPVPFLIRISCSIPQQFGGLEELKYLYLLGSWHYLVLKLLDLIDTVFMILRHKTSHVTFLHVYHHAVMVFFSWVTIRYLKAIQAAIPVFINMFVHAIMYSYYFLATFDSLKKYLWWKRHLTKLQLAQFVVILGYISSLYYYKCPMSTLFTTIWLINIFVIMCLFIHFYVKAYLRKPTSIKTVNKKNKAL